MDIAVVPARCHHFQVAPLALIIGGPATLIGAAIGVVAGRVLPLGWKAYRR